jgi:RHS repeat-associated protein
VNSLVTFLHQDTLGSTRLVTNSSGNTTFSFNYAPYGTPTNRTGFYPFTYTGQPYDNRTGLYYFGARFYDPVVGRFTTEDPSGGTQSNPSSHNTYAYAEDNPVSLSDSTGLDAQATTTTTSIGCDSVGETLQVICPLSNVDSTTAIETDLQIISSMPFGAVSATEDGSTILRVAVDRALSGGVGEYSTTREGAISFARIGGFWERPSLDFSRPEQGWFGRDFIRGALRYLGYRVSSEELAVRASDLGVLALPGLRASERLDVATADRLVAIESKAYSGVLRLSTDLKDQLLGYDLWRQALPGRRIAVGTMNWFGPLKIDSSFTDFLVERNIGLLRTNVAWYMPW